MRSASILIVCLLIAFAEMPPAQASELYSDSRPAGLVIRMTSQLQPLTINQMHNWIINLQDTDGNPITGATIKVDGGMAAHDHGLATAPRVTDYLGEGSYLLQGMRFHMPGEWQLELTIRVNDSTYSASMAVEL